MSKNEAAVPRFADEEAEAAWWFEHQDLLLSKFELAHAEGTLAQGRALRRVREAEKLAHSVTVRITPADEEKARALASARGMGYTEMIEQLIHDQLQ